MLETARKTNRRTIEERESNGAEDEANDSAMFSEKSSVGVRSWFWKV